MKEMTQIQYIKTFIHLDLNKLTIKDIIKALSSLMFLLGKRDDTIKVRTFSGGSKRISDDRYNKHYYDSPTCAKNSVVITSVLEAKEGHDVDIIDIPGTYLHTYVYKHGKQNVIILFKGKLVEIIIMVYPKLYWKCVSYDSIGNAMFYVEINKSLYGLLQSALFFNKKLRKDLKASGFVINPYDLCVANAMIESHQMTVTWHVDNLKVSHKDPY